MLSQRQQKSKQEIHCIVLTNTSKHQNKTSIVLCSQADPRSKQEVDFDVLTDTSENPTNWSIVLRLHTRQKSKRRSIVLLCQGQPKSKHEVDIQNANKSVDCIVLSSRPKIQRRGRLCCAHKSQNPTNRSIVLRLQTHPKSKQEVDCIALAKTTKIQTRDGLYCARKFRLNQQIPNTACTSALGRMRMAP